MQGEIFMCFHCAKAFGASFLDFSRHLHTSGLYGAGFSRGLHVSAWGIWGIWWFRGMGNSSYLYLQDDTNIS